MSGEIVSRLIELCRKLQIVSNVQIMQGILQSPDCKQGVEGMDGSETFCRCTHHGLKEEIIVCRSKGEKISKGHCNMRGYKNRRKVCLCRRSKGTETEIDQSIKPDKSEEPDKNRHATVATTVVQTENNCDEEEGGGSDQPYLMQVETIDTIVREEEGATGIGTNLPFDLRYIGELKEKLKSSLFTESELKREIASFQKRLSHMTEERDDLKRKLHEYMVNEEKRCSEVEAELNRMKHAVKDKEEALETEGSQLRGMIGELTKIVKIQKRRICEMSRICAKQEKTLQEREITFLEKESENRRILCTCNQMKDQIEKLENCLKQKSEAGDRIKQELETIISSYRHDLRIKEKILEDKDDAIRKQKKLLQESERMAQQAAREFEQLTDELYCERRVSSSLQAKLDSAQMKLVNSANCEQCTHLQYQVDCLKRQRIEALDAVRFTVDKLRSAKEKFLQNLSRERRQRTILMTVLRTKEGEIECLKREIFERHGVLTNHVPV